MIERFSNIEGMMIRKPDGGWVQYSAIEGTDQEIKDWMRRYAVHAAYPKCEIRKTGKCTCGLSQFLGG